MRRIRLLTASVVLAVPFGVVAVAVHVVGCTTVEDAESAPGTREDAGAYDASPVAPLDGGMPRGDGAAGPGPTCEAYCKDVLETCTGADSQYGSPEECIWVCERLAPGSLGDKDVDTVACRAYHASTTAKTDTRTWCAAAGPFGGGVCGDRCGAFCNLALAVCWGGDGGAPWASEPDCVTACSEHAYLDGGTDGGGEGSNGATSGDTLNCRLRVLRGALRDPSKCADLGSPSNTCK